MRRLILALCIVGGTAALGSSAQAQNYPWCATYGGGSNGGATNCGFTSFEQCMATVHGMGGFCNRNTQYAPTAGPYHAPSYRRHRGSRHYD